MLSDHFSLEELLHSDEAVAHGIGEQFNPAPAVVNNLQALANKALEPVRELLDAPVIISSGYRCERLNAAVGGEPDSRHLFGDAADITTPAMSVDELYKKIMESNIAFDKLIIEHNKAGVKWVHIQWNPAGEQRGECFTGELQPEGGTKTVFQGYGAFKNTA